MEASESGDESGRTRWAPRFAVATAATIVPVIGMAVFGPQSGLESMVILIPWAAMIAGHALLGSATLLLAWAEERRGLLAGFGLYLLVFTAVHLAWWAVSSGVPEKLETEYVRRHRPADHSLQQLVRDREADPARLEPLLHEGADVDRRAPDGRTPLFDAANNAPELALALLEAGADPNRPTTSGGAPLHVAVRNEDVALAKALLAKGARADLPDENGRTALCRLLGRAGPKGLTPDQLELMEALLEAGADPNEACRAFRSAVRQRLPSALRALFAAGHRNAHPDDHAIQYALRVETGSSRRDLDWVALLVRSGGDPNASMRRAIERGDAELVEVLLEGGADPNAGLPLVWTAGNPDRDAITGLLLRFGADPGLGDEEGRSALVEAARRAHDANVRRFAALGVDLDASYRGEPLLISLHSMIPRRKHVTALLLELGADPNRSGKAGRTPLIQATVNSHHAYLNTLVAAGADLEATDEAGRTALHHAAVTRFEGERVAARLLDAGADLEARDGEGRTPLCVAQAEGNRKVADAFAARGAVPQDCAPPPRRRQLVLPRRG